MKLLPLLSVVFSLLHSHHKQDQYTADITTESRNQELLPTFQPYPLLTQQVLDTVPVQTKDQLLLKIQDYLLQQIEKDNQILSEFQNLIPVNSQPVYDDTLNMEGIAGELPAQQATQTEQLTEQVSSGYEDILYERKHLRKHRNRHK